MTAKSKKIAVVDLGLTSYGYAWDLQREIFRLRASSAVPDVLILNEHEHVYTIGKKGCDDHLLASKNEMMLRGVEVHHIDRGGDITYHGPGQLVGYPVLDLNDHYPDIHRYLRNIEEVIIRTLHGYNIEARRDADFTGVWVGNEKIAAIGIKVSRWITMHGFALNVNTDLSYFDRIIPCGIFHRGVTSIEKITGKCEELKKITASIAVNFSEVFESQIVRYEKNDFIKYIGTLNDQKIECV